MGGEAGVAEEFADVVPFAETAVVEHLEVLGDDERHVAACEAFLEHYQTAYSAISVLERMDAFESLVKVYYVLQRFSFY